MPERSTDFMLVPEFDWDQLDAETTRMTVPEAVAVSVGTNTGTGDREAPKPEPVKRTSEQVVEGFGNNFGEMKSSRLADALKGAQTSIIQKRMDAGEDFGYVTPKVTSDPTNPVDGTSAVPDAADNSRAIDIPQTDPQEFASTKVSAMREALSKLPKGIKGDQKAEDWNIDYFSKYQDVYDEASKTWKQVPLNQ